MPAADPRYRRSPHIVSYWSAGRLLFHNFATGGRVAGNALTIGLLDYFDTWKPLAPLLAHSSLPHSEVTAALRTLVDSSIVQQSDRSIPGVEEGMDEWAEWNPAAGFFHFSTKDLPFEPGEAAALPFLSERLRTQPIPPINKAYADRPVIALPRGRRRTALSRVLLRRRTWRRFGARPLPLRSLGALMHLTFGAHSLMDLKAGGHAMLRTSPSAGARNPIEAYVVVRRVAGLPPGIYHYAPLTHALAHLSGSVAGTIERHLPGQPWYGNASILVLLTAVFARTSWKYPSARAYRDLLLEAGHFCQTFCLVATDLGLAPFCTGALADSLIEHDLGVDGVSEGVLYACGAGMRPPGQSWAPLPDTSETIDLVKLPPVRRKHSARAKR